MIKKNNSKKVVFMMGAPGSGKSFISKREYPNIKIFDCDLFKKEHPDYDPKNPGLVHQWSAMRLEEAFQKSLKNDDNFIIDGTGSNSDRLIRRITEAQENGFIAEVCYVTCSLKTSLKRNRERERTVPDSLVREKFKDIRFSFDMVAPVADKIKVIRNE